MRKHFEGSALEAEMVGESQTPPYLKISHKFTRNPDGGVHFCAIDHTDLRARLGQAAATLPQRQAVEAVQGR